MLNLFGQKHAGKILNCRREGILTEGLRIRRHPCRVVGDRSNRDQLVCKSHVNIARSPSTEVSEAFSLRISLPRCLFLSFSPALVRFYSMPSPVPPFLPFSTVARWREEIKAGAK
ncbi:hypothetical protein PUN28_000692 [Cardiocondyla obscurior]|uniref:Uncharacterized protein n=1 Tax=Cardiocondyla obscurior TaxID=286306 RepID=A0AAW2H0R5_9HYME